MMWPYVFAFLIAFLILSIRAHGLRFSLIFLVTGYLIAWASEAASIRTGFPYGEYFYIYENLQGEWLNAGVPVWDSLSYTFLCYAGFSLGRYLLEPTIEPSNHRTIGHRLKLIFLSALLVTFLDIIIDPLANQGEKWFLGKVYYYPDPGFYFGVPLSNFAGWFLVSFLIVGVNLMLKRREALSTFFDKYSGPAFYFSIFLFNWTITLWIGEWKLALADLLWIAIPFLLLLRKLRSAQE